VWFNNPDIKQLEIALKLACVDLGDVDDYYHYMNKAFEEMMKSE
jgi:hypothetical protein